MAESKNSVITHGLSGTIGNLLVFRQRGGKTIVANLSKESEMPLSKKQIEANNEFGEAVVYGKTIIKDPAIKAIYQAKAKEGQSAYNIAVLLPCSPRRTDTKRTQGEAKTTVRTTR